MKKWLILAGIIIILVLGVWVWLSWSDSKVALMFSGALQETVKSHAYTIPASGTNLRAYEWTSKSGMECIAVFSVKGGSFGDCEFPPK